MTQLAPSVNWKPELVLDVALGVAGVDELCLRYDLTLEKYNEILATVAFQVQLVEMRKELHERGDVFKAKAKVQAELLLETSFLMAQNPMTPAPVRADLIKSTVEWAGLKPSGKAQPDAGSGFSIVFNFPLPDGRPAPVEVRAPVTIDQKQP